MNISSHEELRKKKSQKIYFSKKKSQKVYFSKYGQSILFTLFSLHYFYFLLTFQKYKEYKIS